MNRIYDITKFTMLDYPNELACVVWFVGCNMRCKYCHNPQIVSDKGKYTEEYVKDFLKSRQNVLGAVVFSGGEATLHKNLPEFAKEIKELGFKIKLDTNGSNPRMVQQMIEENLVDYVALDYKSTREKFEEVTGVNPKLWDDFDKTLDILIANKDKLEFEVRTTWHTSLLTEEDIDKMLEDLNSRGYENTFFLQKCNPVENKLSFAQLPASQELNPHKFFGNKIEVNIR